MERIKSKVNRWLRWSEKYTKTDSAYLTKSGFWLWLGQLAGSLSSFASAIAFANLLPVESYGKYRYVLSILNLIAIPTLTGINTSLMKSAAQGMDGSFLVALKTRLTWGIWGMATGFVVATYYLIMGNSSLATSFFAISIFVPIFYSFELYAAFLKGKKLFKFNSLYSAIVTIISTSLLITALFLTQNVTILLVSYFLPYTTLMGLFVYLTLKKHLTNNKIDPQTIKYGKHLSLMTVLSTIAGQLDKLLLWYFIGPAQVAIYSFAEAPVNQIQAFTSKFDLIIFPKIAESNISHLKKVVYSKMLRLLIPLVLLVGVYVLLAPTFYHIIFPQYLSSVRYSQILMLLLLFTPVTFMSTTFTAHAKIREGYYLKAVSSVGNIFLLLLLAPIYGIWGVVASYLIMKVVVFLTVLFLFNRLR